jgi:Holliday junction resolvase-like predicted endonuclease
MQKLHLNDKKPTLGTLGERFVHRLLLDRGYTSYKSNLRKWNFEIDLLVYRVIPEKSTLEIRVVEVKTRSGYRSATLADLKIDQKLLKYRYFLFNIGQEINQYLIDQECIKEGEQWYFKYHLDLAIVGSRTEVVDLAKSLYLQKYIQNVNLLI